MFAIKELGELGKQTEPSLYLGLEVTRTADDSEFHLKQTKLIDTLVAKVGNDITSVPHEKVPIRDIRLDASTCPSTPAEKAKWKLRPFRTLLGIIGYLALNSRNDCCYAMSQLTRWNETYGQAHWDALIKLVAYIKKTRDTHFLVLSRHGGWGLAGYCDSDYNGTDTCQSTSGWIIFFGFSPISWVSRLQRATSRSTAEAEYMALSSISQEAVYLSMLAESLRVPRSVFDVYCNDRSSLAPPDVASSGNANIWKTAVQVWTDSEAALGQAKKPENWVIDKLRHIRTAYHFFKSYVRQGILRFSSVSGRDNPSDVYTKGWGSPGSTAANQKAEPFQRHAAFNMGRR